MRVLLHFFVLFLSALSFTGCVTDSLVQKEKSSLHLQIGVGHLNKQNYPAALRELLIAQDLDPANPIVQNNLGLTYFFRERYDLAERHLLKAVSLSSNYTEARNNYARLLIEIKKYKLAEEQLDLVLNDLTYPGFVKAYNNYGLSKFNQKQYADAKIYFKKAFDFEKDNCLAYNYYGRSALELGETQLSVQFLDKAINFCDRALTDEPNFYSALAYYRLGQKSKALARFEELIKLYPDGIYKDKAVRMSELIKKGH